MDRPRSREQAPWISDDQLLMNQVRSLLTDLGVRTSVEFRDRENGFLGPELARWVGISNRGLLGVLSRIAGLCMLVGRVPLWEYDPRTGRYFVDLVVRELLHEAL